MWHCFFRKTLMFGFIISCIRDIYACAVYKFTTYLLAYLLTYYHYFFNALLLLLSLCIWLTSLDVCITMRFWDLFCSCLVNADDAFGHIQVIHIPVEQNGEEKTFAFSLSASEQKDGSMECIRQSSKLGFVSFTSPKSVNADTVCCVLISLFSLLF